VTFLGPQSLQHEYIFLGASHKFMGNKSSSAIFGTFICRLGLVISEDTKKLCCISKSMGIHFPHNIRIRLAQLKKYFLGPDFPPSNLLFFNVFLGQVGVEPS
jgi:hypothetical protein